MENAQKLSDARTIALETYRRNGAAVKTPVWLVLDGGSLYVRTDPRSGKAKRIRANPSVRLAPSDMRGNVKGDWSDGRASFVTGDDAARILKLFKKKYGLSASLLDYWHRLRGMPPYAVISVALLPAQHA